MSTASTPVPGQQLEDDEKTLHRLGYAQELFRSMDGFQNVAISFTIISILAGCLTSYYIAFNQGGPVAVTWGWLIVGLFCIIVSLAMGEVASTFPTAGGLYYWASKLGSPAWGWFTAGSTSSGKSRSRPRSGTDLRSSRPRCSTCSSTTRTRASGSSSRTPS